MRRHRLLRRHRILVAVAACAAGAGTLVALPSSEAGASTAPLSTTGQRWALKVNGDFVTVETGDSGPEQNMLRAVAPPATGVPTTAETFTLQTEGTTGYGSSVSLRSETNDLYVSDEVTSTGSEKNMLRARSANAGAWERFQILPLPSGEYALKSEAAAADTSSGATPANSFVSARFSDTGAQAGMLQADTAQSAIGSWERITLVPLGNGGGATAAPPATTVKPSPGVHTVASYNLCSNNNPDATYCKLSFAEPGTIGPQVASGIATAMGSTKPEAVFFQEVCEADAKPIETALEAKFGGGWDVRFQPTYYKLKDLNNKDTPLLGQKICAASTAGNPRGTFGAAIAVNDSNTWYQGSTLPSPEGKEQRPVICATVPDQGAAYCSAHFSDGGASGDDPDNTYRPQQASAYSTIVHNLEAKGYTTFFGGDLNTVATSTGTPTLAALYSDSRYGSTHKEADTTGPTDPGTATDSAGKLDYIFGPTGPGYTAHVVDPKLSDHKLIYANITF